MVQTRNAAARARDSYKNRLVQHLENQYESVDDVVKIFGNAIDTVESFPTPAPPRYHHVMVKIQDDRHFDVYQRGSYYFKQPQKRYRYQVVNTTTQLPHDVMLFFQFINGTWHVKTLPISTIQNFLNRRVPDIMSPGMTVHPKLYLKTILKKNPSYLVTHMYVNTGEYYKRAGWPGIYVDLDDEFIMDREFAIPEYNRFVRTVAKHRKPLKLWAAPVLYKPKGNRMKRKFEEWGAQFENERSRLHTPPPNATPAPSPAPKRRRRKVVRRR
jgi:hypothetical protein